MGWFANSYMGDIASGLPIVGDAIESYRGREQQQYDRGLQDTVFQREDTSYQRGTADMHAAGLSPVMAAGGGGADSGAVVKSEVAKNNSEAFMNTMSTLKAMNVADKQMGLMEEQRRDLSEMKPYKKENLLSQSNMMNSRAGTFSAQADYYRGQNVREQAMLTFRQDLMSAQIESSNVQDLLNISQRRLTDAHVDQARMQTTRERIQFAWEAGHDSVVANIGGQEYRFDLTSLRYLPQRELTEDLLALAINKIAEDHAGYTRDIARHQAEWVLVNQLASLIQGGMQAVGPAIKPRRGK